MTGARRVVPLAAPPDATISLPGSKSLTNRALVCAALAEGRSTLANALVADDTEAMVGCLRALGIEVTVDGDRGRAGAPAGRAPADRSSGDRAGGGSVPDDVAVITVRGTGGVVPAGPAVLDARLSGTTSRFLAPVLAAGAGRYLLDGAPGLRARPMGPLVEALRDLGAEVAALGDGDHLPLAITAHGRRRAPNDAPVRLSLAGNVSSQFLSGLLLAGPLWPAGVTVEVSTDLVSRPYVDMTIGVMADFGVGVGAEPGGSRFTVPAGRYRGRGLRVEPDASAASYFFAAAAVCGGRVRVAGLGVDSRQGDVAFVDILARMGASVERGPDFVEVRGGGPLHGVDADLRDLSDTTQTLAAVAVFADSPTRIRGVGFIRGKETDRIGATVRELRRCGIEADELDDGLVVHPGTPRPARVETYDDHRMAMSFAVVGLRAGGIEISDPGCVAKTFPGFWSALDRLRL